MLIFARNGQEAEDGRNNENIIHRQRLFDHIAGEELKPRLRPARKPDPSAEGNGDADIAGIQDEAFLGGYFFLALVQEAKIENEKADDDRDEGHPKPYRRAEKIGKEHFHEPGPFLSFQLRHHRTGVLPEGPGAGC